MSDRPTILFDLDGTLADTARDLVHTMNVLLVRHGRTTVPEDQIRRMVGAGARKIMDRGFSATGAPVNEAQLDKLFEEFLEHYGDHIADHTVLFPGVLAQLEALTAAGAKLAVCTNKAEKLTHQLLEALEITRFFPVVIGGDTLPVRKPDPLHLHEAVERSGGSISSTIMVGDSAPDFDAARAAQVRSICVTFGYTETPAAELGADVLIDHFDALPSALNALLPTHFGR